MPLARLLLALALATVITGCAHPIQISPDLTKIERAASGEPRLGVKVGYYIPPEVAAAEITTAGGGGDNVRYFPYRDMEAGFQKVLSNVFTDVVKLSSFSNLPTRDKDSLAYVIIPVLVTSSGGSGFFTWPPTNFTVDLTSQVRDGEGKFVASPRVVGTGTAETGERLSDHGIAGKRALEDALQKMQKALTDVDFKEVSRGPPTSLNGSVEERLTRLKQLRESGAITQQEYESNRKAILEAL